MAYTNVAKPGVQTYTNINTAKPSYDDASINYDDSAIYYDGFNPSAYTNLTKPTSSVYTKINKPT